MIGGLKEVGKTITIASHSITFVEEVADRVAMINEGKILEVEQMEAFIAKLGKSHYVLSDKPDDGPCVVRPLMILSNAM